jgi:formylmethanofuran dehydrogenase subunit E
VTNEERLRLQRHEEWISRPVRDLFPRAEAKTYTVNCRGCKTQFVYTRQPGGKMKFFCTSDCKTRHYRQVVAPSSLCPPGAGSGLGDPPP